MDITEDVTYRGLLLTGADHGPGGNHPIEGIRTTRVRFGDVSVHGYTEKKSLDDGFDASDVFLGTRVVNIRGELFARDKAGLFDMLDLLRLKFTPTDAYNESPEQRGYLPLGFSQPTGLTVYWPTGFIERVLYCRPSMQPEHDLEFSALGEQDEDGYVVPFTLQLEAKDPRFYNPLPVTEYIVGTVMTQGSGNITNRGNYPAPLNMLLHTLAAQEDEATFTFVGYGSNMTVTIPGGAEDRTIRVDSINKVCTLTVGEVETLRMDLITFTADTTWPKVLPTPEGAAPDGYNWSCTEDLDAASRFFLQEAWA